MFPRQHREDKQSTNSQLLGSHLFYCDGLLHPARPCPDCEYFPLYRIRFMKSGAKMYSNDCQTSDVKEPALSATLAKLQFVFLFILATTFRNSYGKNSLLWFWKLPVAVPRICRSRSQESRISPTSTYLRIHDTQRQLRYE